MNSVLTNKGIAWIAAPLVLTASLAAHAAAPAPAAAVGFDDNTFSSTFTTATVDMNSTLNRGYKWYIMDLFSKEASATGVHLNSNGSVTLVGDTSGAAGSISTVRQYRGTNNYVGTAFGGGAYIESVMSFNPAQVASTHVGGKSWPYPAFWSLAMEGNVLAGTNQWPGQATGYVHNMEMDMFEADYATAAYGAGLHEWYGISKVTCPSGLCVVSFTNPSGERTPKAGTSMTAFHTYGFLWVPATATVDGHVDAYFDGVELGTRRSWTQYTNQAPTPVGKTWTFGHIDQQHFFFMLGTGIGETFEVNSVNVWQKNALSNLAN